MIIVSDTTTISNLFLIGKLSILENLFGEIMIPKAVFLELERLEDSNISIEFIRNQTWILITEVENRSFVEILQLNLDIGESEAITLAKEKSASLLIIDELKGRQYAKQLNINIIGLVGILLQAKQEGIVDSVKETLEELKIKAGFWVSKSLYETALLLSGENK